jgi:hypothetical protein
VIQIFIKAAATLQQMATKRRLCQRKTEGEPKKGLANLWRGKKITKKAHAGRGQTTKWEIPGKSGFHTRANFSSSRGR